MNALIIVKEPRINTNNKVEIDIKLRFSSFVDWEYNIVMSIIINSVDRIILREKKTRHCIKFNNSVYYIKRDK